MVLYLLWIVTLTAPLIALTLAAGCAPLPRRALKRASSRTRNDAADAAVASSVAGEFWKRENSREIKLGRGGIVSIIERTGPPDEELTFGRRVAITEFSVEFVDVQFQNPFGHPTMIMNSSAPTWPGQPGTEQSVPRTQQAPMSPVDQIQIAQALRDVFERYLQENGLIIVPRADVTACAAYANLQPRPSVSSSWAQLLTPMATDTGVVLRSHTVASAGLGRGHLRSRGAGHGSRGDQARDARRCRDGRETSRRHRASEGRPGTI